MEDISEIEVLLVEDNELDVEFVLRIFSKSNLSQKIFVAKNGDEALEFISQKKLTKESSNKPLKLILLDIKLPGISGLEILQTLKSDEQMRHTPIVILTSSDEERDIVKSYEYKVNGYIVKEVDFDKFNLTIEHTIDYWLKHNIRPD